MFLHLKITFNNYFWCYTLLCSITMYWGKKLLITITNISSQKFYCYLVADYRHVSCGIDATLSSSTSSYWNNIYVLAASLYLVMSLH